jgi:ATP-dependent helicase HepA
MWSPECLEVGMSESRFRAGDRVRLRVDASAIGRVDGDPVPYSGGWTYPVFFGANDTRYVAETGLEPAPEDAHVAVLTRDEFLRSLLLAKLRNPLSNFLYAYQASRTQFEPYQFKPVFKYLDAPVQGILIADEVGLGKTIEAAILYQELKARQRINRILIVCPAGLRLKWQSELLTRFEEQFNLLRRPDILNDIRLYHETDGLQPLFGITGLETIRGREIQAALDERPVRYDMVIIDEAHHLRTAGRLSNRIGERLSELTDNLVLLTATPLQTSQQDLFNLLRFIDETQFQQFDDFVLQLQPNANLNAAIRALRSVRPDLLGAREALLAVKSQSAGGQVTAHPNYQPVLRALENRDLDGEAVVQLQREIDQMNVISTVYTRTRKRDVAGVAKRQAYVINVSITPEERTFYDAVLADARAQAMRRSATGMAPGWAGMMRERQAASCMTATREYLTALYRDRAAPLQVEDSSPDVEPDSDEGRVEPPAKDEISALLDAAKALGSKDSKFEAFELALRTALEESADSKVIVFSFFRRTLAYLDAQLRSRGYDVLQINGDVPPDQRAYAIERFRTEPKLQILLSSEVGAEGLDFQFCDTMFNYDLPWNPMRVEQRIGRIDRYGQKRDKIRIYSFFLEGTIEERILERLYERIGIFEDSIGDLEPILGPLSNALTREIFSTELTPLEEEEVAARYANLVLHRRAEERDIEARSAELLGQDALILQAIDETVSAGRYISAAELRAVVSGLLADIGVQAQLSDGIGDGTAVLQPDLRVTSAVQETVSRERDTRPGTTEFLAKLNRAGRIPVTFDGETAMTSRRLELLNLRHPLVRTAIAHFERGVNPRLPVVDLVASSSAINGFHGTYSFGIFLVALTGAQSQTRLISVVLDELGQRVTGLEERLLWLIQEASTGAPPQPWSALDRDTILSNTTIAAAAIADQLEAVARERNDAVLAVREATLNRTIRAKISKRRAQITGATDERIQRMWTSEIRNLEQDLRDRLGELESRRAVGLTYAPIGGGRITFQDTASAPLLEPVAIPAEVHERVEGYPEPPARNLPWA